ncbi:MAG: hypothetical protein L3J58_01980 [Emcibacter sp.]|nr:hypothetical protein [Emcibacter sp.]
MSIVNDIYPFDSQRVILREVGLRDGLQQVRKYPSTVGKVAWISQGKNAGLRHFEVGSFLPPKRYPQFADVRDLINCVNEIDEVFSSVLVMNERAIADAVKTNVDELVCVVSATEEHSQANMRRSQSDSIDLVRAANNARKFSGRKRVIVAAIPMSFGCSISGEVPKQAVLNLAASCLEAGADAISIADTVGFAAPLQITDLARDVVKLCAKVPVIIHLHDTRGLALANAAAALDVGINIIDGAVGGLGGCPFAPGATGNVVLEDLVFLCERMGFRTDIDLQKLIDIRQILAREMPDEILYGTLARAGPPPRIYWGS